MASAPTAASLLRSYRAQCREPGGLEFLEPRQLLSAFVYTPAADAFNLEQFIRSLGTPPGGAEGRFGALVEAIGDIDGDGSPDFAVSAPGIRPGELGQLWGGPAGAVYLYSGRTLELIRSLEDGFAGFGGAMANMGDLDGDGVPDLAIGSPNYTTDAGGTARIGRVWIFSGADGSVIRTLDGLADGDELGWALANVTDVNGDGVNDLIVGAPGAGGTGAAYVYSGADGAVLFTFTEENQIVRIFWFQGDGSTWSVENLTALVS